MKSFALAALWVLASVGAVTVAWAGVSVVDTEVIAPPPATVVPLFGDSSSTDGEDDETAAAPADLGTAAISSTSTSTTSTSSPSTTSTSLAPAPSPTEQSSSGDSAGAADSGSSSTTVPTASSSTAPTTTSTTFPPVTSEPEPGAQTLTFTLIGGTTTISFSSETVTAVATAHPDFVVKIEPNSPGLKVEFRSVDTNQRSRIDAWWDEGPKHEITERES